MVLTGSFAPAPDDGCRRSRLDKEIWNSPQGVSLFKSLLSGQKLSPQDQQTMQQLKQADPPKPKGLSRSVRDQHFETGSGHGARKNDK